jgi:hypothetical protein
MFRLTREDFHETITKVWQEENRGDTPMKKWQNKIRTVRRFLRGWAKNVVRENRKKKCFLVQQLDALDIKAETSLQNKHELEFKHCLSSELSKLQKEVLYWLQRSKATKLTQGDNNTKYFHLIANGRHRKTRIIQLEQDEALIVEEDNLRSYITNYYKVLFGPPESNLFSLDENLKDDIPQVSDIENEIISGAFSEVEIKEAIFQMEKNKAPGPDGFPAEFYQYFWETIKMDIIALFNEFCDGNVPLHRLNFGTITLLPKGTEAIKIQ